MIFVTVFRHVPRPITGMIGVVRDHGFEVFEADLDWLETTGVLVERFDPATAPEEVAARPAVQQLLSVEGPRGLPLILVNDVVILQGGCPSRTQLARAVGRGRKQLRPAIVRQFAALGAAAAVGSSEALEAETARARESGISEDAVRWATEAGISLRRHDNAGA